MQTPEVLTIITDSIVCGTCNKTRKGKNGIMSRIREFFISSNTFLGHQIGISTTKTRWTIFIMNVHHKAILRTFLHRFVHPPCPYLRADLYKTELNTRYTP